MRIQIYYLLADVNLTTSMDPRPTDRTSITLAIDPACRNDNLNHRSWLYYMIITRRVKSGDWCTQPIPNDAKVKLAPYNWRDCIIFYSISDLTSFTSHNLFSGKDAPEFYPLRLYMYEGGAGTRGCILYCIEMVKCYY